MSALAFRHSAGTISRMTLPSGHRRRVKHFHEPGDRHELTFSCYQRLPLLTNDRWRRMLAEAVDRALDRWDYSLVAYVFMPEHVHLLVFPNATSQREPSLGKVNPTSINFLRDQTPVIVSHQEEPRAERQPVAPQADGSRPTQRGRVSLLAERPRLRPQPANRPGGHGVDRLHPQQPCETEFVPSGG